MIEKNKGAKLEEALEAGYIRGGDRREVTITAPKLLDACYDITGQSPYTQNKFSEKAKNEMMGVQAAGSTSRKGKKREPKDFEECFRQATHTFKDGSYGMPATCFRNAMIAACRLTGFKMTHAKLAVFIVPDGFSEDGTPLVRINGTMHRHDGYVRLPNGKCDIRPRPMWDPGWTATVRVRYDADQFTVEDISNLFLRAGLQVGVGEGRPSSPNSCGMGWGTFDLKLTNNKKKEKVDGANTSAKQKRAA